ncbi:hypothetical protein B0H17DRAFT_1141002 [Mycena rosella]|uniref:Uncharacterized protein n=1 Tax=Mycena rosella TaxID=1033263 RepID=A0AAD7D0W4_MYCRO|nr:hypothetical protein B0H17DRAFT_1141002 [Mycena rosella]
MLDGGVRDESMLDAQWYALVFDVGSREGCCASTDPRQTRPPAAIRGRGKSCKIVSTVISGGEGLRTEVGERGVHAPVHKNTPDNLHPRDQLQRKQRKTAVKVVPTRALDPSAGRATSPPKSTPPASTPAHSPVVLRVKFVGLVVVVGGKSFTDRKGFNHDFGSEMYNSEGLPRVFGLGEFLSDSFRMIQRVVGLVRQVIPEVLVKNCMNEFVRQFGSIETWPVLLLWGNAQIAEDLENWSLTVLQFWELENNILIPPSELNFSRMPRIAANSNIDPPHR